MCIADDLTGQGCNFMIWNPSIRKLVTLPKPTVTFKIGDGYKTINILLLMGSGLTLLLMTIRL